MFHAYKCLSPLTLQHFPDTLLRVTFRFVTLDNFSFSFSQQMVGGKVKKPGKRGRKPAKIDLKAKLERSRQSARECRARKKLRYQYLEEMVSSKERAICALREELEMVGSSPAPPSVTRVKLDWNRHIHQMNQSNYQLLCGGRLWGKECALHKICEVCHC